MACLCLSIPLTIFSLDFDKLTFMFFPCGVDDEVIVLEEAKLVRYEDNEIQVKKGEETYSWQAKNVLYRGKKSLGCYMLLCITWDEYKYDIIADSTVLAQQKLLNASYPY